jgi:transcriptional regulator with XRE-family HTH domain
VREVGDAEWRPRLGAFRQATGLTQDDLADQLVRLAWERERTRASVNAQMVSKWERGRKRPSRLYRRLLCTFFQASEEDLGLRPWRPFDGPARVHGVGEADDQEADVNRRDFLRSGSMAAGLLATGPLAGPEPWERLLQALDGAVRVDRQIVADLEARTAGLHQMEGQLPAHHLYSHVSDQLERISFLLRGGLQPELRRQLVITAGETAALAGWLAWDVRDRVRAMRFYDAATAAAREAADPALLACVNGYLSYMASADGDGQRARTLIERGLDALEGQGCPRAEAWLAGRAAEEAAGVGEALAAFAALERMRAAELRSDSHQERSWTTFLDSPRLGGFAVATYVRLGWAESARAAAAEVLLGLGGAPEWRKRQAVVLTDIARFHLASGDVEEGLTLAESALVAALKMESSWGLQQVAQLRPHLQARQDLPQARRLHDRLLAACA